MDGRMVGDETERVKLRPQGLTGMLLSPSRALDNESSSAYQEAKVSVHLKTSTTADRHFRLMATHEGTELS